VQTLLRHVVPLAFGAAISPTVLAVAVLTLTAARRPVARGALFAVGVFVMLAALSVLGLTVMSHVTDHPSHTQRAVSDGIDVAFGLVLFALAARTALRGRRAGMRDGSKDSIPTPPTGDDHATRSGLATAFATGIVMMATNVTSIVLYLPAMKEVAKSDVSDSDKAIVTVVAMVIVSSLAWLPVLLRIVAPGPSQRLLTSINTTIQTHRRGIVMGVEVLFGTYLLVKGLRV
jgi:threonine/homoserine/homoserine lactone efflux protein